jgi:tetratricopeptide (TPR) repeat protein
LSSSLNISPDDAYVINYLAYSWIEKGINIEKSLQMLKKANELRPNDGYITDSLGWALFKLKKYKEAKKYMQEAVRLMASDPVINDHFADVLWMSNNSLQARYYWNYALKLEKTEEKLKKKIERKLLFGLKSHDR